jgi:hypothetical protein
MQRQSGSHPLRALWDNTDAITKWIQVLALIVAGYWTYTRFIAGEAPSLEPRLDVTMNVQYSGVSASGNCNVKAVVGVKNSGKRSFDVQGISLQVFRDSLPKPSPSKIATPIDLDDFERGTRIYDNSSPHLPLLLKHFAPGESADQSVSWLFTKQEKGVYFFKVDVKAIDEQSGFRFWSAPEEISNSASYWDENICVE